MLNIIKGIKNGMNEEAKKMDIITDERVKTINRYNAEMKRRKEEQEPDIYSILYDYEPQDSEEILEDITATLFERFEELEGDELLEFLDAEEEGIAWDMMTEWVEDAYSGYYIIGTYQAGEFVRDNYFLSLEILEDFEEEIGEQFEEITNPESVASLMMYWLAHNNIMCIAEAFKNL